MEETPSLKIAGVKQDEDQTGEEGENSHERDDEKDSIDIHFLHINGDNMHYDGIGLDVGNGDNGNGVNEHAYGRHHTHVAGHHYGNQKHNELWEDEEGFVKTLGTNIPSEDDNDSANEGIHGRHHTVDARHHLHADRKHHKLKIDKDGFIELESTNTHSEKETDEEGHDTHHPKHQIYIDLHHTENNNVDIPVTNHHFMNKNDNEEEYIGTHNEYTGDDTYDTYATPLTYELQNDNNEDAKRKSRLEYRKYKRQNLLRSYRSYSDGEADLDNIIETLGDPDLTSDIYDDKTLAKRTKQPLVVPQNDKDSLLRKGKHHTAIPLKGNSMSFKDESKAEQKIVKDRMAHHDEDEHDPGDIHEEDLSILAQRNDNSNTDLRQNSVDDELALNLDEEAVQTQVAAIEEEDKNVKNVLQGAEKFAANQRYGAEDDVEGELMKNFSPSYEDEEYHDETEERHREPYRSEERGQDYHHTHEPSSYWQDHNEAHQRPRDERGQRKQIITKARTKKKVHKSWPTLSTKQTGVRSGEKKTIKNSKINQQHLNNMNLHQQKAYDKKNDTLKSVKTNSNVQHVIVTNRSSSDLTVNKFSQDKHLLHPKNKEEVVNHTNKFKTKYDTKYRKGIKTTKSTKTKSNTNTTVENSHKKGEHGKIDDVLLKIKSKIHVLNEPYFLTENGAHGENKKGGKSSETQSHGSKLYQAIYSPKKQSSKYSKSSNKTNSTYNANELTILQFMYHSPSHVTSMKHPSSTVNGARRFLTSDLKSQKFDYQMGELKLRDIIQKYGDLNEEERKALRSLIDKDDVYQDGEFLPRKEVTGRKRQKLGQEGLTGGKSDLHL